MKFTMKKNLILAIAILTAVTFNAIAQTNDPVILNVGGENISKSEFERVYKKNNTKETSYERKAVTDYLMLYVNYKLKVKEALEMGMDTAKSFTDELTGYRKQLAQPYLTDKDVTENLLKEAYNRLKTDVRASHILIKCTPDALPKDTLDAYNKAIKVRDEVMKGDFAAVAKAKSDDPSAKDNGGDLGYFTAMQMVYPFESAAFTLKKGDMSMPVRTRFGYHIIKLTDSRNAQGEVKVAHIMVKCAANASPEDSTKAVAKVNEINGKLKAGDTFEDLAKQFSDDQGSAKNGGVLPVFGTGRMVPEFEKVAFELKNVGDVSAPIKTSYGWHIIKLIEKKPLGTFEELQNDLKQKVSKDSRAELSKTSMVGRIKTKYNFKEVPKSLDEFVKTVDSTLSTGKWTADKASALKNNMFSVGDKNYSQQDFAKYVNDHQSKRGTGTPQSQATTMYNDFINESALAYEETKLDVNYPEFKMLMQEYRDGILLFELTDKKVWSKAVKDTTGLKDFYDAHKTNYMWGDRLEATIYTCSDADIAKQTHKLMKTIDDNDTLMARINKTSQLSLQIKYGKFAKGDNENIDGIEWKAGLTKDMPKNKQVIFIDVKQVMKAQPKTLEEAKGLVTADYQSHLEKEWITSLRAKYKVEVHQDVVDSMIK